MTEVTRQSARSVMSWAVLACLLSASRAAAAEPRRDVAGAEALADEGDRLAQKGQSELACGKYEASADLDPSARRWLRVADCRERANKPASAWLAYREALASAELSGDEELEQAARLASERLLPMLIRLKIESVGNDFTEGFAIQRDDAPLALSLYGVEVPVDPGAHRVSASAPGYGSWSVEIELPASAGVFTVVVPPLHPRPSQPRPVLHALPAAGPSGGDANAGDRQRTIAWILGGAGAVGLAVGAGFGIAALSSDARSGCAGDQCPSQSGLAQTERARSQARAADVFVGLGLASLASGVLVYWLAPPAAAPRARTTAWRIAPLLGPTGAGLAASQRF